MSYRKYFLLGASALLALLLLGYAFRYFVYLPYQERARFNKTESIIDVATARLDSSIALESRSRTCIRMQEKYGDGPPYCYIEVSFAPGKNVSSEDIFLAFDGAFTGAYRITASLDNAHQYEDGHMRCFLESPDYKSKNGPQDQYTIRCIDQVTRYVY